MQNLLCIVALENLTGTPAITSDWISLDGCFAQPASVRTLRCVYTALIAAPIYKYKQCESKVRQYHYIA